MTLIVIQWFWIALIFIQNTALLDGCLEFLKQPDVIDRISKYFLIEKMAFLLIPNICFHHAQTSWNNFFSLSILISMKEDGKHISVNTAIALSYYTNWWCYIHNFRGSRCSEHFWKYPLKSPYFNNECMWKLYLGLAFHCRNLTFVFTHTVN